MRTLILSLVAAASCVAYGVFGLDPAAALAAAGSPVQPSVGQDENAVVASAPAGAALLVAALLGFAYLNRRRS